MTGGAASQGPAAQQRGDSSSAAAAEGSPTAPPAVADDGRNGQPFGVPSQQSVPQGPESVAEVRENFEASMSSGSSLGGPKLSKVDEVQSSMERSSSDIVATDDQGRQGKSSVLEGIHEQERSQQNSSSRPFTARNDAAMTGAPNSDWKNRSSAKPTMTAGMVAITISRNTRRLSRPDGRR